MVLVVLAVVGLFAVTRLHVFGLGPQLVIKSARVTVDRPSGRCPSFAYSFTGRVTSNGAGGRITYRWLKPDGTTTNTASASIPGGDAEWTARLLFTFQGQGHATGDAVLMVVTPTKIKSPPARIEYHCP
ncbi:MAG TPA: hypothetical protein VN863_00915 [Candidatus Dormibacteraeota bacterium]|nr:hypothetical protein [Candidatus Dormibacteraeota bacterium]